MMFLVKTPALPAFDIKAGHDQLTGNFDTTISFGSSWRVEKRDEGLVGVSNGGKAPHANGDDGNLNYDRGLISLVPKVTHELDLNYRNYSLFVRGHYFYDIVNENKDELSDDAKNKVGKDAKLLDAYMSGNYLVRDQRLNVRMGNQVLSWGESTFIQNGINIINPVNVSMLRSPGSELRNALIPVPMASVSYDVMDNITFEGFYQIAFIHTEIDPPGTYFSAADIVGDGGEILWLGPEGTTGAGIYRTDKSTSDSGQFGMALRIFSQAMNETEFGLFYINYHSRLPVVSARTGTLEGVANNNYAGSSRYVIEYPEDIHLFGASFNTMLKTSGVALQGEISFRPNMPLQADANEVINAIFTPLGSGYTSQLGAYDYNEEIQGFKDHKVGQAQATASKFFGPDNPFKATNILVLGEAGFTYVLDMEDKDKLKYDGPESSTSDAFSWGYHVMMRLDYTNAIGAVTLSPVIAFSHDVGGVSPGPGGNFIEGRKAVSVGLAGSYLERWRAELSYTGYFGAEDINLIHDRDFIMMNMKYFF
jgi:hypothetical protein